MHIAHYPCISWKRAILFRLRHFLRWERTRRRLIHDPPYCSREEIVVSMFFRMSRERISPVVPSISSVVGMPVSAYADQTSLFFRPALSFWIYDYPSFALIFAKTLVFQPHNTDSIMKEQVLQAMREAGKPVSAGDVTKALNADRKEVDKAFAELKKEGAIVSPVRCKWEPAK